VRDQIAADLPDVLPRIWRYSLALTGRRPLADDLVQSVCVRALERADQFQPGTHLDRWLFRLAHNIWISDMRKDVVRKGQGMVSVDEVDLVDHSQNSEANLERRDIMLSVFRLPEAQRQTVVLVYVEGYSYKEASEILNIPLGTVMSRLAAARATLAQKFRNEGYGADAR